MVLLSENETEIIGIFLGCSFQQLLSPKVETKEALGLFLHVSFLLVLPPCSSLSAQERSLHPIMPAAREERKDPCRGKNTIPSTLAPFFKKWIILVYLSFHILVYSKCSNLGKLTSRGTQMSRNTCNSLHVCTHVYFGKSKVPQLLSNY